MTDDTFNDVFTNQQEDRQETTQELRIQAPAELDLEPLAEKLSAMDGVQVELEAEASGGDAGADQEAVAQQARSPGATAGRIDDLVDSMTWGRTGSPAAKRTAEQLERGGR